MTRFVRVLAVASALLATVASAQPPPGPAERLSLRFDFEQDVDGDAFPDGWRSVDGRHPQNIRERLDAAERRSGKTSFLVEPDGRASVYETTLAYRFDPRFSYRLSGWIRTQGLPASGLRSTVARIEGALLEADGLPPVAVQATDEVYGSAGWSEVTVDIPRDVTSAARFVRLRLVVEGTALSGKVWFDDVAFEPQSALRVAAGRADGLLSPDNPRVATVTCDALIDRDYRLAVRLLSPDGGALLARTLDVTPDADFVAETKVELPFRAFGLHRIELELTSAGRPVASASQSVLYLSSPGGVKRDVGVAAGGAGRLTPERAAMFARAGVGTVTADIFWTTHDPAKAAAGFARLRVAGIEPVAVLGLVPPAVIERLFRDRRIADAGEASWLRILAQSPGHGSAELAEALKPVAPRTLYYQLGSRPEPDLSASDLRRALARLRETLAPLTWDRKVALVVRGTEPEDVLAAGADVLVLAASASEAGAVEERLKRLRGKSAEVWVEVAVPRESDGVRCPADLLIERIVQAKAAGADRVIVTPLEGGRACTPLGEGALLMEDGAPTETLGALATVARELGGKRFVRKLATKTPAWLFTGDGGVRLAVIPSQSRARETIPLAVDPVRIDPDGNVLHIPRGVPALEDSGRPYFIDGVDLEELRK